MSKSKKAHRCEQCRTRRNVKRVIDPYREEVYSEKIYIRLCQKCLKERILDI